MTDANRQGTGLIQASGGSRLALRSVRLASRGLALAQRLRSEGGTIITLLAPRNLPIHCAAGGYGGKTFIATNLATAIVKQTTRSVAIVDLDTMPDIEIWMNIPREFKRNIADLAIPEAEITLERVRECLYEHETGVNVLQAPIMPIREWKSVLTGLPIERIVLTLAQTHDYVVLDTPWKFNTIVSRSVELASMVVLVARAETASLKDSRLAIDVLRSWNLPREMIKLVTNAITDADKIAPQEIRPLLGRDMYWSIPFQRDISKMMQLGTPLVLSHPDSGAAHSLFGLAEALIEELDDVS